MAKTNDATDELRWETPPPAGSERPRTKWEAVADQLRARPGEWAIVAVLRDTGNAASVANNLRHGRYSGVTKGEYEAASRKVGDECRVYLRYVGPEAVTQ